MSLVPRHCATRCERRPQKPHCTAWFLIRRAAVRLPSVPTVYPLSFSQQLGFMAPHTCFTNVTLQHNHCYGNDSGTRAFNNSHSAGECPSSHPVITGGRRARLCDCATFIVSLFQGSCFFSLIFNKYCSLSDVDGSGDRGMLC